MKGYICLNSVKVVPIVGLLVTIAFLSGAAMAQCGVAFDSAASVASLIPARSKPPISPLLGSDYTSEDNDRPASIVGLWHVRFLVGGNEIQEAFQIWNAGGTEVHNPKVDPRSGSLCLGTWLQSRNIFKLNHRVWLYDPNGNFQGIGFLTESITIGNEGATQSGTFTLTIYDPNGNQVASIPGTVVGERITVN
jgi:hypothetical protein